MALGTILASQLLMLSGGCSLGRQLAVVLAWLHAVGVGLAFAEVGGGGASVGWWLQGGGPGCLGLWVEWAQLLAICHVAPGSWWAALLVGWSLAGKRAVLGLVQWRGWGV